MRLDAVFVQDTIPTSAQGANKKKAPLTCWAQTAHPAKRGQEVLQICCDDIPGHVNASLASSRNAVAELPTNAAMLVHQVD